MIREGFVYRCTHCGTMYTEEEFTKLSFNMETDDRICRECFRFNWEKIDWEEVT